MGVVMRDDILDKKGWTPWWTVGDNGSYLAPSRRNSRTLCSVLHPPIRTCGQLVPALLSLGTEAGVHKRR